MTREDLRQHHPELYEQLREQGRRETIDDARKRGRERERDRCRAHTQLGEASGAFDVAHAAMRDGSSVEDVADTYVMCATDQFRAQLTVHVLRGMGIEIGGVS